MSMTLNDFVLFIIPDDVKLSKKKALVNFHFVTMTMIYIFDIIEYDIGDMSVH